jgi:glycosyltransferase involved in cell wall biosynthesis
MRTPRFSILVPSFNQRAYIPETIGSILYQTGGFEREVLVIDGGSTDGTVEWLSGLRDPRVIWTSERDNGHADAVNKGLQRARGDIVGWLNSDDTYLPGAFEKVAAAFSRSERTQWVVGRASIMDGSSREIRKPVTAYKNWALSRLTHDRLLRQNVISQMGVFWRRSFGAEVGSLDERLKYALDYDLWLRMSLRSRPCVLEEDVARFRWHPRSKTTNNLRRVYEEARAVAMRYEQASYAAQLRHRLHAEQILLAYRCLKALGV